MTQNNKKKRTLSPEHLKKMQEGREQAQIEKEAKERAEKAKEEDTESQEEVVLEVKDTARNQELEDAGLEYISSDHFYQGYAPKSYRSFGDDAPEDLVEIAHKHFNPEDDFIFLYNARDNHKFTVIVPLRWSNIDANELRIRRCDARTIMLEPGAEKEILDKWAQRVVKQLAYNKVR